MIQAIYLGALLAIPLRRIIVVRQVLIRRELDESAKNMGERIRAGDATAEEYFEMGSIMLRKKVYTQAVRNLKLAASMWEGDQEDLAQIHNALGSGTCPRISWRRASRSSRRRSSSSPGTSPRGTTSATLERMNDRKGAMAAYEESLVLAPNSVAANRLEEISDAQSSQPAVMTRVRPRGERERPRTGR